MSAFGPSDDHAGGALPVSVARARASVPGLHNPISNFCNRLRAHQRAGPQAPLSLSPKKNKKRAKPEPRRTTAGPPARRTLDIPNAIGGHVALLIIEDGFSSCTWYVGDTAKTPTVGMVLEWLRTTDLEWGRRNYVFQTAMDQLMRKTTSKLAPEEFLAGLFGDLTDFGDPAKWQRFEGQTPPMPVTIVNLGVRE